MCYHAGSDPGKVGENFMQILRASEDYLETMLMMQQQHGYIRSIDVAEHLGVTKPITEPFFSGEIKLSCFSAVTPVIG